MSSSAIVSGVDRVSSNAVPLGSRAEVPDQSGAFAKELQAAAASHSGSKNDPQKIANAAKQFEALMIGQILKSAHGSDSSGWLGAGEDDDTASTGIEMAEEYLGQAIANGGGLGIAKTIVAGITKQVSKPATE